MPFIQTHTTHTNTCTTHSLTHTHTHTHTYEEYPFIPEDLQLSILNNTINKFEGYG